MNKQILFIQLKLIKMKPGTNRFSQLSFFLPVLYLSCKKTPGKVILFLIATTLLSGCFQHYFRTNTQNNIDAATIQKLMSTDKYIIVHSKNRVVGLTNATLVDNKLEADIVPLPLEHSEYLNPQLNKTNRVARPHKEATLMEVHLYNPGEINMDQNHLSFPLSSFNRVDIYELDKSATTGNHVVSWVGVVVGTTVVAGLIAFAIACNCPQVYVNNGRHDYQFVSGVYSGAVYSSLERSDFLPLHNLQPVDNTFTIKIKNAPGEEQFINRMQLLQVTHPENSKVLIDRHGNVFTYEKLKTAQSAIINGNIEIAQQLSSLDNDQYLFDDEKTDKSLSQVLLAFKKPDAAQKAKLVIHGGNSLWSGYLYHSFAALFGKGYEKWRNEKEKSDPAQMEQWQKDQGLPLMVYIERNGKWEFADYFIHTGNTATRDLIMELNVSDVETRYIKIKLETVYQFWNLDFAGIDFSENVKTEIAVLDPVKATKPDRSDQRAALNSVDKNYSHLIADEELNLEYQYSKTPGSSSYFFVSTGYYHNLKKLKGSPQIAALLKFKNKNAFDDFSRKKFADLQKGLRASTASK